MNRLLRALLPDVKEMLGDFSEEDAVEYIGGILKPLIKEAVREVIREEFDLEPSNEEEQNNGS